MQGGFLSVLLQTHRRVSTHFHCQFSTPFGISLVLHRVSFTLRGADVFTPHSRDTSETSSANQHCLNKHRKLGEFEHHTPQTQKLKLRGHEHLPSHTNSWFSEETRVSYQSHGQRVPAGLDVSEAVHCSHFFTSAPIHHLVLDLFRFIISFSHPLMFLVFRFSSLPPSSVPGEQVQAKDTFRTGSQLSRYNIFDVDCCLCLSRHTVSRHHFSSQRTSCLMHLA